MNVAKPMHPRAGRQDASAGASGRPYPARGLTFSSGGAFRLPVHCPGEALRAEQEVSLLVTSCRVDTSGTDRQYTNSERHRLSPTALRCQRGPKVSTVSTMSKESIR